MWPMLASIGANLAGDLINKLTESSQKEEIANNQKNWQNQGNTSMNNLMSFLPQIMQQGSWNKSGLNGAAAELDNRIWQGRAGGMFGEDRNAYNQMRNAGNQLISNVFAQNANASKIAGQSLGNMRVDAMGALNNVGSSPASISASLGKLGQGNMAGANQLFQTTANAASDALKGKIGAEQSAAGTLQQGRSLYDKTMVDPHRINKENVAGLFGSLAQSQGQGLDVGKESLMYTQNPYQGTQSWFGKLGSETMNKGLTDMFRQQGT